MQVRDAKRVEESVQADEAVRDAISQRRPRRQDALMALAVVAATGALVALLIWVVFLGSEDGPESATPTAGVGSAVHQDADGHHERYYSLPHGKEAPLNAGVGSAIIHDDAGNVNRSVTSTVIHDDAWNMPRDEGSAIIHDDAGNMPVSPGTAVIHDDAGNVPSGVGSAIVHDDAGNVNRQIGAQND